MADVTVWIVEDVAADALDATNVVVSEAGQAGVSFEIYWDNTIRWESLLSAPPPANYQPKLSKLDLLPTIVVLDLFADGGFLAEQFLRQLRRAEGSQLPRSWVILWSVNTSFPDAQDLLYKEPQRDRKLIFTKSKDKLLLRDKLTRCLRSWKEERFR